jgi:hypothetical protein
MDSSNQGNLWQDGVSPLLETVRPAAFDPPIIYISVLDNCSCGIE